MLDNLLAVRGLSQVFHLLGDIWGVGGLLSTHLETEDNASSERDEDEERT